MKLFSQRHGYKPVKNVIQLDSMDSDLRNGLWNALDMYYWSKAGHTHALKDDREIYPLIHHLWLDYFKRPTDSISFSWANTYTHIRSYFFSCDWYEVYDFVEFVASYYYDLPVNKEFMKYCNEILERELSGYRFIGEKIAPITAEEEITEIEKALESTDSLRPVVIHLQEALKLFSDRKSPDYRNSIKESISAVEAIRDKLSDFMAEVEEKKDNALIAISIFENLERKEEEKISSLFGKASPISKHFREITSGIYQEVEFIVGDVKKVQVRLKDGSTLDVTHLSGGAYDQLYLSIRLALGEKLLKGSKGFFIMDDPFIKADKGRLQRQIDILKRVSKLGWQIIYFTAKDEVRDVLKHDIQSGKVSYIELQGIFT